MAALAAKRTSGQTNDGLDLVYVYSKTNSSHPCSKHTIGSRPIIWVWEVGGRGRGSTLDWQVGSGHLWHPMLSTGHSFAWSYYLGVITLATLKLNEACIQYSVSQASEACMSVVLQISVQ